MRSEEPIPAFGHRSNMQSPPWRDGPKGRGGLSLLSPLPWKESSAHSLVLTACLVPLSLLLCLFSGPAAFAQDDLQTGVQLFEAGQLVEARQFFEALHQQQPTNTSVPFYLGRIAYAEKNYEQAIPWFEEAVDGEQCNADYHVWLGRAYGLHAEQISTFRMVRKVSLVKRVRTHFEKAVSCDPTHVAAHWTLMEYYLRAPRFLGGSRKKAEEQATIITRLDPTERQKVRQFITQWTTKK